MTVKDNESYYDEFADWYERHRHGGYHALIDDLETDLVVPLARDRDVLEIGCGTGLILRHVDRVASLAVGIDISEQMLRQAHRRGLNVARASATALPFSDEVFDLVYSFKVLAHVPELERALAEAARVTRVGGELVLEFYNPLSLRYLAKKVRKGRISDRTTEAAVYTRFDSLASLKKALPPGLELTKVAGIRVFTPHAALLRIPGLGRALAGLEWLARDSVLGHFGGFLALRLRRRF
jgi:ubiquinone/menaquinone biosynthesis C-methylase UbiE